MADHEPILPRGKGLPTSSNGRTREGRSCESHVRVGGNLPPLSERSLPRTLQKTRTMTHRGIRRGVHGGRLLDNDEHG